MSKILLDISPTGVQHYLHMDQSGDECYVSEHTPTIVEQKILDECHALRGLKQYGRGLQLAAKVPINTHFGWKKEWRQKYRQHFTWGTFLAMKINDRSHKNLRVGGRFQKL